MLSGTRQVPVDQLPPPIDGHFFFDMTAPTQQPKKQTLPPEAYNYSRPLRRTAPPAEPWENQVSEQRLRVECEEAFRVKLQSEICSRLTISRGLPTPSTAEDDDEASMDHEEVADGSKDPDVEIGGASNRGSASHKPAQVAHDDEDDERLPLEPSKRAKVLAARCLPEQSRDSPITPLESPQRRNRASEPTPSAAQAAPRPLKTSLVLQRPWNPKISGVDKNASSRDSTQATGANVLGTSRLQREYRQDQLHRCELQKQLAHSADATLGWGYITAVSPRPEASDETVRTTVQRPSTSRF